MYGQGPIHFVLRTKIVGAGKRSARVGLRYASREQEFDEAAAEIVLVCGRRRVGEVGLAHRGSLIVAGVSGRARWRDEVRGSLSKAKIRPRVGCGRRGRSRKRQSDRKQQEFSHGKDSLLPVARGATTFAPLIALTLRHDRSVNPFATIRVPAPPQRNMVDESLPPHAAWICGSGRLPHQQKGQERKSRHPGDDRERPRVRHALRGERDHEWRRRLQDEGRPRDAADHAPVATRSE